MPNSSRKIVGVTIFLNSNEVAKALIGQFKLEDSTGFGCVSKVLLEGRDYSLHYLELARTLSVISQKINLAKVRSMIEIGGGFGANVHIMLQNFPNLRKVIYLDMVPNLFVGTEYLRNLYGKSVKDYIYLKDHPKINFSNNDDLEIMCIPPWLIESLSCQVDYFHDAHSFVEMPENVVKNYVNFVEKILSKDGYISLVSYDNFDEETTFNPDKLSNYFSKMLSRSQHRYLLNPNRNFYCYITS